MSAAGDVDWESASTDVLQDGVDDGEPDAIAEYGSRVWRRLQRAESLLHRWVRVKSSDVKTIESRQYETHAFLSEPQP